MSHRAHGRQEPNNIGHQLGQIRGRLNYLETRMADLDPQGSKRVLERCTELEELMREHCNKVFAVMKTNSMEILKTMEKADHLVKQAEEKSDNLKANLSKRADKERQETMNLLNQLKATVEGLDTQASNRILELESKFQQVGSQILQARAEIADLTQLCERGEAAVAEAQTAAAKAQKAADIACKRQPQEWSTPNELKAQVCLRSRSVQPDSGEMKWIVHLAQESASRSPTRLHARRTLSSQRLQPNRGRSSSTGVAPVSPQPNRGRSHGPPARPMRSDAAHYAAATLMAAVRARANLTASSSQSGS